MDWVGRERAAPRAEALETNVKMWVARVSAWEGWYVDGVGGADEVGDESEGCAAWVGSVEAIGAGRVS